MEQVMKEGVRRDRRDIGTWARRSVLYVGLIAAGAITGCRSGPTLLQPNDQVTIDRQSVEYPAETELKPYVTGLTGPTALAFDNEGSMLIAESGIGGREPRIFGFKKDGEVFEIYPRRQLPSLPIRIPGIAKFKIYPPIGGMVAAHGRVYVSHRDENGQGVITAFGYDGSHTTIVAKLPAQGDYSVTDIAMAADGRLYFGMGTATNSAVVGLTTCAGCRNTARCAMCPRSGCTCWGGDLTQPTRSRVCSGEPILP
jgi:glucose/arabinose dehydrogenase